jgi:hypothetical protein
VFNAYGILDNLAFVLFVRGTWVTVVRGHG